MLLRLFGTLTARGSGFMATNVRRFEQDIAGHHYVIEASPVAVGRWRAQIARRPGVPSALMPFYGSTPDDAASRLMRWLSLAHRVPLNEAGTATG